MISFQASLTTGQLTDFPYFSVPSKLQGVEAQLQKDGTILVTCLPAATHSPSYYMLPVCDNENAENQPMRPIDVTRDTVTWQYISHDAQSASKHVFDLWAQDEKGNKGEVTRSNEVISSKCHRYDFLHFLIA